MSRTSTTTVAAISPRLIAAVHSDAPGLLAASATATADRADDMGDDEVVQAMRLVAAALETLGDLFLEDGSLYEAQLADLGTTEEGEASAKHCHSAGWDMRAASRSLAAALAALGR